MVKIAPRDAEGFVADPDPKFRGVLVYGPDEGLVRERVAHVVRSVLGAEIDPFRFAEFGAGALEGDPARLNDEAAALSLSGGRRVVLVRGVGDGLADQIDDLFAERRGDALVVCEAGNLPSRSRLRKAFEGAAEGAAVACYEDSAEDIARIATDELRAAGLEIERAALGYLTEALGADRAVTRREIEKLALYKSAEGGPITLEEARACVGDASAVDLEDLAYATAEGDTRGLDAKLARLLREGNNAVAILRAVARHLIRLQLAASKMERGQAAAQAMAALRPPVFYQRKGGFERQLRLWNVATLWRAQEIISDAELDCKTTGMPDEALCGRALIRVAAAARGR